MSVWGGGGRGEREMRFRDQCLSMHENSVGLSSTTMYIQIK